MLLLHIRTLMTNDKMTKTDIGYFKRSISLIKSVLLTYHHDKNAIGLNFIRSDGLPFTF